MQSTKQTGMIDALILNRLNNVIKKYIVERVLFTNTKKM